MSRVRFIDSGPLGYAFTPTVNEEHLRAAQVATFVHGGDDVIVATTNVRFAEPSK